MKDEGAGFLIIIFYIVLLLGWCLNIYKFVTSDFEEPYKNEIIRGVGIPVFIVGSIAGYVSIDDQPKFVNVKVKE